MGDAALLELQIIKLPGLLSTVDQNRALLILSKPSTKPISLFPHLQVAFSYIIDRTGAQSDSDNMILVDQNFTKVTYLVTSL